MERQAASADRSGREEGESKLTNERLQNNHLPIDDISDDDITKDLKNFENLEELAKYESPDGSGLLNEAAADGLAPGGFGKSPSEKAPYEMDSDIRFQKANREVKYLTDDLAQQDQTNPETFEDRYNEFRSANPDFKPDRPWEYLPLPKFDSFKHTLRSTTNKKNIDKETPQSVDHYPPKRIIDEQDIEDNKEGRKVTRDKTRSNAESYEETENSKRLKDRRRLRVKKTEDDKKSFHFNNYLKRLKEEQEKEATKDEDDNSESTDFDAPSLNSRGFKTAGGHGNTLQGQREDFSEEDRAFLGRNMGRKKGGYPEEELEEGEEDKLKGFESFVKEKIKSGELQRGRMEEEKGMIGAGRWGEEDEELKQQPGWRIDKVSTGEERESGRPRGHTRNRPQQPNHSRKSKKKFDKQHTTKGKTHGKGSKKGHHKKGHHKKGPSYRVRPVPPLSAMELSDDDVDESRLMGKMLLAGRRFHGNNTGVEIVDRGYDRVALNVTNTPVGRKVHGQRDIIVAGCVVAGVGGLLIVCALIYLLVARRQRREHENKNMNSRKYQKMSRKEERARITHYSLFPESSDEDGTDSDATVYEAYH